MKEIKINRINEILEIDNCDVNRPKLSLDFNSYLVNRSKSSSSAYGCGIYPKSYMDMMSIFFGHDYPCDDDNDDLYGDVYGGLFEGEYWNGWDEDEYDDELYPSSRSSKEFNKKKEKEKSSPARVDNKKSTKHKKKLFDDVDDIIASDSIVIKFYKDLSMSEDYLEFDNLYEFDDYCEREGIHISEKEVQLIMNRAINYCAIDPKLRAENGELWIKSDSSYGSLRWECIDNDDELIVNSNSLDNSKYYS